MTRLGDRRGRRHTRGVAVVTCLVGVVLAACGGGAEPQATSEAPEPPVVEEPEPEPVPEPEPEPATDPAGEPERVVIPAIDVDAELVRLGLEPDGAMEVPDFGWAGWYAEGPPPGHPGPAVVAAHVDSRTGPDVFYRLRELEPGDEVVVRFDSGDEAAFVVTSSERIPKDELPGDRIWPVTNERLLTLITCGGDFDRSVRSYRDNVIVYTTPVDA